MAGELGRTILDPPVFLAPMAGITDPPFRRIARRFGAGLVVSEMIASREMLARRPCAPSLARDLGLGEPATAVQLAGCEPAVMAEAARRVAGAGAAILDINMGCPAKKVTNGWSGSALMRDPDAALRIVEAVVRAVPVPVTLKVRLGWDHASLNAPEIAARAEAAGVRMIAVHGRTRCQFYTGVADWDAIAAVNRAVRIPVVANGDIRSAADAARARARSGAAAVMIGRGAQGRPWLLGQVAAALAGRPVPAAPTGTALRAVVAEHYEAMLEHYGRALGARVARKHLGWYLAAAEADPGFRRAVLTEAEPARVLRALRAPWPVAAPRERAA
jgi:tRNA-dihydrouridine synthase B